MQAPDWARIWGLFEGALQRGPDERASFLEDACSGDAALRREVESLLASHESAGAFIEKAVSEAAAALLEDAGPSAGAASAPGRRIGPWEVVREVGRGGMGAVFLAERADGPFRLRAAVKVLRSGHRGDEPLRRFQIERSILAALDHPNIARMLDGGSTEEGDPYVAMEYVDGEPIDAFCDGRRLTVAGRLRLFRSVCGAVQYAHRNLVVHRDIKPSNILVTAEGAPKLLDFGIAKLLSPPGAGAPETRTGLIALTPEYASPEQVKGGPITTASDVYSLGVLLYELLAGRPPHRLAGRSPAEIERTITETDPERPSAAVGRAEGRAGNEGAAGDASPAAIGAARGASPERLRRILAGDLDNIVLAALCKEPERRYASVEQLSEDLGRYLEGLPVHAHPPGLAYRARKFAGRHPWGVSAAAAFALLLAGSAAALTAQSARLAAERDRALAAEERARTEAAAAEQTAAFLVDLFKVSDPEESRGRAVTAREILDLGARRIGSGLEDQPEVRARLQRTLADVYANLGDFEEARRHAEAALEMSRTLHGEDDPEVARALAAVGSLHEVGGDHAAAERDLVASLEMRRRLLGPKHSDVADGLARLAGLRHTQGRFEEAESLYREALETSREANGPRDPATAAILRNFGWTLSGRGKHEEAEKILRESLAIREEALGEDHPDVGMSLGSLGDVLRLMSRFEEAETVERRFLEQTRRVYGPDHHRTALALTNLSSVLKEKGDLAEAEALAREALDVYRKVFGEEHAQVALALNNLANLRQDQGDLDGAVELHRRSMAVARKVFGDEHPSLGDSLNNLANALWDKGDYAAAEKAYREALALDRRLLGPGHPYVAMDLNNLALVVRDRGDLKGAEPLVKEALDIQTKAEGAEGPTTALYVGSLGALYTKMGRLGEAERLLRESLRIQESKLPAGHWRIHQTRGLLAECLAAKGDLAGAEAMIGPSVEALERTLGPRSGFTRRAREAAAAIYEKMGRRDKAAAYRSSR